MKDHEITKMTVDGLSIERTPISAIAFEIFLKKMPSMSLTNETRKGFESAVEQSVEIAELFVRKRDELLKDPEKS